MDIVNDIDAGCQLLGDQSGCDELPLRSRSKKSHDKIGVGVVIKLNGVIVQSDKTSWLGAWIIRPVEMLDLHLAGIGREIGSEALAIHAGLDVELEDGRRFVVEQFFGTSRENFVSEFFAAGFGI